MPDFLQSIDDHKDLSEAAQKKVGKAIAGDMSQKHTDFAKKLSELIRSKKIDPMNTDTFLNMDVYKGLNAEMKLAVDKMLPNLATLLSHIVGFYDSKETPNASPELQSLIENLWQMIERVESEADVFVF